MNLKLKRLFSWFREESLKTLCRYPIEMLLILCTCVGCLIIYEMEHTPDWAIRLPILPLFALLALAVNHFLGAGPWRKIYWVCWTPLLIVWFWPGFDEWLRTPSAAITFCVLAPLVLLLCRRAVENSRFVCDALVWLRSGVLAVAFANVALGLFCAILYSTTYIFGLSGDWIEHVAMYAVILFETLAAPMLFLMMSDRWKGADCQGNRIIDVLVNYIITPALLIYTVILYLYMIKILFLWELPRGGVAYLVFGFTLAALIVQALQLILQKHIYNWFFNHFSLIALSTQVLFWVGVLRRVGEYGVTTPRVYLLVCGGLMTLCVALFLSRKLGRYLWVALAAWVVFALMAYIPGLSPERIATRSQANRAERIASRLGMLSKQGALRFEKLAKADTTQCSDLHSLYESLDYIEYRDTVAFARFGLHEMSDFTDRLPGAIRSRVIYDRGNYARGSEEYEEHIRLNAPKGFATNIEPYRIMYSDLSSWDDKEPNCRFENDTLRIWLGEGHPEFRISGSSLLSEQLRKINATNNPGQELLQSNADQLLTYTDGEMMVLFSSMNLLRGDSTLRIDDVSVAAVLMR